MKKYIFSYVMFCLIISYANSQNTTWRFDSQESCEIPIGVVAWDAFYRMPQFQNWLESYLNYYPDENYIDSIAKILNKNYDSQYFLEIDVYFGAWCGDSQEHLPKFMKMIKNLKQYYDIDTYVTLYACNRDKKTEIDDIDSHVNIEFVPTFFFSLVPKDNNFSQISLGKIVETPQYSLEQDMFNLLNDNKIY